MKRLDTKELVPGMITAEDVYTYSNQLILPKGLVLTDKTITKLEFYSVLSIRVEDKKAKQAVEIIEDPSYSERIQSSKEFIEYKTKFDKTLDLFKVSIFDIVKNKAPVDTDFLLEQTLNLLKNNGEKINLFLMLHNMRQYDDLTFAHSINVALICNQFAQWLHFSKEDIELATLCGLLHDIGKLSIPDSIIKKPDKLTVREYKVVKTHPLEGYNILKSSNINEHIKNSVLMHHERFDGTGYPLGISSDKIDKFANIVSIADVYEAMTSKRIYRGPLCPFKVIELFESEGLQKYNADYIITFLRNIITTQLGSRVRLNNGETGEVIFINQNDLANPTIKSGQKYIDLSKEPNLHIETII
ncbi:MAG TPA: HD-GYP domain-containing protein [Lachnospiraceae bacterium]|nr:HD-GYP domain-containing protein [Lachnospiraceae bacterium]